jgi:hypothetical protein
MCGLRGGHRSRPCRALVRARVLDLGELLVRTGEADQSNILWRRVIESGERHVPPGGLHPRLRNSMNCWRLADCGRQPGPFFTRRADNTTPNDLATNGLTGSTWHCLTAAAARDLVLACPSDFPGSRTGSQCRQTASDGRPPLTTVDTGQPRIRRRQMMPSGGRILAGGQGVAGSNPAVPTQVRRLIRNSDRSYWRPLGPRSRILSSLALLDGRSSAAAP